MNSYFQLAALGIVASAASAVLIAVVRLLVIGIALRGTKPKDRRDILEGLARLFRSERRLGPVRRRPDP